MPNEKTKPVKVIRDGTVSVSIWRKEHKKGPFFTISPSRAWFDDENQCWEYSDNFYSNEAPVLANLLNMAHIWVCSQKQKEKDDSK